MQLKSEIKYCLKYCDKFYLHHRFFWKSPTENINIPILASALSSLQWVGLLTSEKLRKNSLFIEQSNWVAVCCHCNTFWQFTIILQVFKKTFLDALSTLPRSRHLIEHWLWIGGSRNEMTRAQLFKLYK